MSQAASVQADGFNKSALVSVTDHARNRQNAFIEPSEVPKRGCHENLRNFKSTTLAGAESQSLRYDHYVPEGCEFPWRAVMCRRRGMMRRYSAGLLARFRQPFADYAHR